MAMLATTKNTEIETQSRARPMNSKLVPGLMSSRNGLWVAMVIAAFRQIEMVLAWRRRPT